MGKKDDMPDPFSKYKKKLKRLCCCGTVWFVIGVALLITGSLLLHYYRHLWNVKDNWKSGLAYAGAGMIGVGALIVLIGIGILIALCVIARRLEQAGGPMQNNTATFHKTHYEYGKAPYPQQPPEPAPQAAPAAPVPPPYLEGPPKEPSAPGDVHVDISHHDRY